MTHPLQQIKKHYFVLMVVTISIALWLFEPMSSEYFAYDRYHVDNGDWWRLITGHFLHTNFNHMVLNLCGLTLLWALHGDYYRPYSVILLLTLCALTSLGIYCVSPLNWYVGLSGALHGVFVIGAYYDIKHQYKTGWLLLVGVWLKVIYEQIYGANEEMTSIIEANVAVDAHLFGTMAGSLVAIIIVIKTTLYNKVNHS